MSGKKRSSSKRPSARPEPSGAPAALSDEEQRFVQALIARGEAARAVNGVLPENATHEIVEDADGHITVVRRRFVG